jgi:hypothetical protein
MTELVKISKAKVPLTSIFDGDWFLWLLQA